MNTRLNQSDLPVYLLIYPMWCRVEFRSAGPPGNRSGASFFANSASFRRRPRPARGCAGCRMARSIDRCGRIQSARRLTEGQEGDRQYNKKRRFHRPTFRQTRSVPLLSGREQRSIWFENPFAAAIPNSFSQIGSNRLFRRRRDASTGRAVD